MPEWTKDELLAVARDMREHGNLTAEQEDLFVDEEVVRRFDKFGGIIRTVLPSSKDVAETHDMDLDAAIENANVRSLMIDGVFDMQRDCSYLLHFNAPRVASRGGRAFRVRGGGEGVKLASPYVREKLRKKMAAVALEDLASLLIARSNNPGSRHYRFNGLDQTFEQFVAKSLLKGVKWKQQWVHGGDDGSEHFSPIVSPDMDETSPKVETMCCKKLYYPNKDNYPFVDMLYKGADGLVVGIQVTYGSKPRALEKSAWERLKTSLGITGNGQLHYVLCRPPLNIISETKDMVETKGFPVDELKSISIVTVAANYRLKGDMVV